MLRNNVVYNDHHQNPYKTRPLTVSRCSEVTDDTKTENGTPKWWSLLASGLYLEMVINSTLKVHRLELKTQFVRLNKLFTLFHI